MSTPQNTTPSPTQRSNTVARITSSTQSKPGHPLFHENSDSEGSLAQLDEESLKQLERSQRQRARDKRMTRSGSGGGGGGARRRRVVKKPWKGWRIFMMKLYMIVALMPGIPMMPKIQTNQPTKIPSESVLQRFRRVVVNNFRKGDNKSTKTNDEDESLCIATKQPTLTFKPAPGLIKPKTLRQLKCRGDSIYYPPSTNNQLANKILDTNAEIVPVLRDMFALLKPSKELFDELNDNAFDMCTSGNENVVYWVPKLRKIGWVRNSCKAKGDRYANYDVYVLFSFSKSDEKVIEVLQNHSRKLYDVVPGFDKDWKDLTHADLHAYGEKYGITPYLKISLYLIIHRGADKKRGILPNVYPMLVESAAQWYWKEDLERKFSVHEWLHYPCKSIENTFQVVKEYLDKDFEPSMSEFCGRPLSTMNFDHEEVSSCSWGPQHCMTEIKLHERPTDEGINTAIVEVKKLEQVDSDGNFDLDGIAHRLEETFGIELSSQEASAIVSDDTQALILLKNKISKLDEPKEGEQLFIASTHGLYDKFFRKWGSRDLGMWVDPIPFKEGQGLTWGWDATQIPPEDRRNSRFHIKSAVMKMKELHGPQSDAETNAVTKPIDHCIECFRDAKKKEKLDQMMKDLEFQQVSKFGESAVYGHR